MGIWEDLVVEYQGCSPLAAWTILFPHRSNLAVKHWWVLHMHTHTYFAVSLQKKFPEELECVTNALVKFPQGELFHWHKSASLHWCWWIYFPLPSLESDQRHMLPFVSLWVCRGANLHGQELWNSTLGSSDKMSHPWAFPVAWKVLRCQSINSKLDRAL